MKRRRFTVRGLEVRSRLAGLRRQPGERRQHQRDEREDPDDGERQRVALAARFVQQRGEQWADHSPDAPGHDHGAVDGPGVRGAEVVRGRGRHGAEAAAVGEVDERGEHRATARRRRRAGRIRKQIPCRASIPRKAVIRPIRSESPRPDHPPAAVEQAEDADQAGRRPRRSRRRWTARRPRPGRDQRGIPHVTLRARIRVSRYHCRGAERLTEGVDAGARERPRPPEAGVRAGHLGTPAGVDRGRTDAPEQAPPDQVRRYRAAGTRWSCGWCRRASAFATGAVMTAPKPEPGHGDAQVYQPATVREPPTC